MQDGSSFPSDLINAVRTHKDDPAVVEQGVLAIEALATKCPHFSKTLSEVGVEEVLESAKGVLTNPASEYPDRALAALDTEAPPHIKFTSGQYKQAVSAARAEGECSLQFAQVCRPQPSHRPYHPANYPKQ